MLSCSEQFPISDFLLVSLPWILPPKHEQKHIIYSTLKVFSFRWNLVVTLHIPIQNLPPLLSTVCEQLLESRKKTWICFSFSIDQFVDFGLLWKQRYRGTERIRSWKGNWTSPHLHLDITSNITAWLRPRHANSVWTVILSSYRYVLARALCS